MFLFWHHPIRQKDLSTPILVYALKNDFAAVLIEFFGRMQKDKLQFFFSYCTSMSFLQCVSSC